MVRRKNQTKIDKSYEPVIAVFNDGTVVEYANAKEAANDLLASESNIREHIIKGHKFNGIGLYFKSIYNLFIKNKKRNGNKDNNA